MLVTAYAQSPVNLTIRQVPLIEFGGDLNAEYRIEGAHDPSGAWEPVGKATGTLGGWYNFVDTERTEANYRFYRAVKVAQGPTATVSLNAASPLQRIVRTSRNDTTENVVLGRFDVKASLADARLKRIDLSLSSDNGQISKIFSRIGVQVNGQVFEGEIFENFVRVSNLNAPIPRDQVATVTVLGSVNADIDGSLNGTTVKAAVKTFTSEAGANPLIEDVNGIVVPIAKEMVEAAPVTFLSGLAHINGTSVDVGNPVVANGVIVGYTVFLGFDINVFEKDIWVPKSATFRSQSTVGTVFEPAQIWGDSLGGDTKDAFFIPAGGSRKLYIIGVVKNTTGTPQLNSVRITGLAYGESSPFNQLWITHELEGLRFERVF